MTIFDMLRNRDNAVSSPPGGMFGTGPLNWQQKIGLGLAAAGDAANNARGIASSNFADAIGSLRDANQRRALATTPFAGEAGTYVQRLIRLGVPVDVALRVGLGYFKLRNARGVTAANGKAQGAVAQPSGAAAASSPQPGPSSDPDRGMQSPAVAAAPAGSPPPGAPPSLPTLNIPMLAHPDQARSLPSGHPFLTPDWRLKQAP